MAKIIVYLVHKSKLSKYTRNIFQISKDSKILSNYIEAKQMNKTNQLRTTDMIFVIKKK